MPDYSLEPKDRINDLCKRCRDEMMSMLGLDEEGNQDVIKSLPTYHVESKSIF